MTKSDLQMEPSSAIVGAVIAGASFALHETSARAVREAYEGVKRILIDVYKIASFPLLEKNPQEEIFRSGFALELRNDPRLLADKDLFEKVGVLIHELRSLPHEKISAQGLSVEEINAYQNVILARISNIAAGKINAATGDVVITDVGGRSEGN